MTRPASWAATQYAARPSRQDRAYADFAQTWLDEKTAPPGDLAKCKNCNNLLNLLLQLNGDLPDRFPGHERRLYLWACKRKACRRKNGSVRAFRAIRASAIPAESEKSKQPKQEETPHETPAPAAPKTNLGESLFGVKPPTASSAPINPFATGGASSRPANPFSSAPASSSPAPAPTPAPTQPTPSLSETFATKARISSPEPTPAVPSGPREPWPQQSSFPSPYPSYYLDADYETLDAEKPEIPAQTRVDMDIDAGEGASGGADMDVKDAFESSMDKAFQRFADRMSQNPEQILRYEFAGSPLLYSKTDAVGKLLAPHQESAAAASAKVKTVAAAGKSGMPKCTNCGGDRLFELQLTPYAIVELEAEELGLEGMEWGTVILGVCSKDCVQRGQKEGEVGYVEEWVGVQWEELSSKK